MTLVVADSSALIALAGCDSLGLLDRLFERVRVPSAVAEEVLVAGKAGAGSLGDFLAGKVETTDLRRFVIAAGGLGRGEVEAMALFLQLDADFLLIDDRRARAVARINEIETIGSLGVLVFAKRRGLVPALAPPVEKLKASRIHLSASLVATALRAAGEE